MAPWVAVIGLFDPLTAVQACRLADIARNGRRKLFAIVLETKDALLPANARAELLAALRDVDLVATAEPQRWQSALPEGADVQIVEDAEAETARSAEFVQFVLDRQRAATKHGSIPVPHT